MSQPAREHTLVNLGSGPRDSVPLPALFDSWKQLRVDVDPAVQPDIVANLTDLSQIPDATADAVWAAHCIEHLYEHEVVPALREFRRVVRDDGFVCIIVPDLQAVAAYVAADRMHEHLYEAEAGPVTPHDIFFGYGQAIAKGRTSMAHRCGFTLSVLQKCFEHLAFEEVVLCRRPKQLELVALARVVPMRDQQQREALFAALHL